MTGPKAFKFCKACGTLKPVEEFYRRSTGYLSVWCKPCTIADNNRRKAERRRLAREARLALPPSELKTCTRCQEAKAPDEFYARRAECKECIKEREALHYADPENRARRTAKAREYHHRTRAAQRTRSLARYGISAEQYDELYDAQDGRCVVCRTEGLRHGTGGPGTRTKVLCVDHAHDAEERVRGLLCPSCNRGIGLLGDDVDRLRSAIDYLTRR